MPELWVRFDKDDAAIMGDAYVDLMMLTSPIFDAIFVAHGHKPLLDIMGITPEEHDVLQDSMPQHMRRSWRVSDAPWTSAATGLAMCRNLRRALDERPEDFTEWPGMAADVVEIITSFEQVLERARARGASFQTVSSF